MADVTYLNTDVINLDSKLDEIPQQLQNLHQSVWACQKYVVGVYDTQGVAKLYQMYLQQCEKKEFLCLKSSATTTKPMCIYHIFSFFWLSSAINNFYGIFECEARINYIQNSFVFNRQTLWSSKTKNSTSANNLFCWKLTSTRASFVNALKININANVLVRVPSKNIFNTPVLSRISFNPFHMSEEIEIWKTQIGMEKLFFNFVKSFNTSLQALNSWYRNWRKEGCFYC